MNRVVVIYICLIPLLALATVVYGITRQERVEPLPQLNEVDPPPVNLLDTLVDQAFNKEDAGPGLAISLMMEADFTVAESTTAHYATAHVRHPARRPDIDGGLPVVCTPQTRPLVGKVWSLCWLTQYIPSYPDGYPKGEAVRPDAACALIVSLKQPPSPQLIPGGSGGMLQVNADYVLVPERVDHLGTILREGRIVDFVQDDQGRIRFGVRWPEMLSGLSIYCQLLVADRRVVAGCVPTDMVEIHIGNQ